MPPSPTERILNLAAFLNDRRRAGVTLDEIARSVPGYRDDADGTDLVPQSPEWEAVRRKVRRDFASLQDDWGITVTYVEEQHRYRLDRAFFTPGERKVLIAAASAVAIDGLDDGRPGAIGSKVDDQAAPSPQCTAESFDANPGAHQYCCKSHERTEAEFSDRIADRRSRGELNPQTWPPVRDADAFEVTAKDAAQADPFGEPSQAPPADLTIDELD